MPLFDHVDLPKSATQAQLTLLSRRWHRLAAPYCDGATADLQFQTIVERHGEPARAYHTLVHVNELLSTIDAHPLAEGNPPTLELAVWYHDIIYDPRAKDNESQSAIFALTELAHWSLEKSERNRVAELIRLTQSHQPPAGDATAALLLDADLSVLGWEPERYRQYAAAIREEYGWVDLLAYCTGRSALLQQFLKRPTIYQTAPFQDAYEHAARINLSNEISRLDATAKQLGEA